MLVFWQQNGAARWNGAEQARSLRAPPVVAARIAKDIVKFNAPRDRAYPPSFAAWQPAVICPNIPAKGAWAGIRYGVMR